jgi:hypothetical protein
VNAAVPSTVSAAEIVCIFVFRRVHGIHINQSTQLVPRL